MKKYAGNNFETANASKNNYVCKEKILQELRTIPGVGKSISFDLWNLGIHSVDALKNKNPEMLYRKHCALIGQQVDVFRCAVYYASHKRHDPELLLWWNWKDQ